MDFYGTTFVVFILAIFELYAFCYIYGTNRMCQDIQFMLGFIPNIFWKACWWVVTPGMMSVIMIYILWNFELITDGEYDFPVSAHVFGWCLTAMCLLPLPAMAIRRIISRKGSNMWEVIELISSDNQPSSYTEIPSRNSRKLSSQRRCGDLETQLYTTNIKKLSLSLETNFTLRML